MVKSLDERKKIIIDLMSNKLYVPMKEKELAIFLQIKKEDREQLKEVLDALLDEHLISISKRGKYTLFKSKYLTGVFRSTTKSFGFVEVEGFSDEFYIDKYNTLNAMHMDVVEIEEVFEASGRLREARVVKIVERNTKVVVGTYDRAKNHYGFVIPDNAKLSQDIFVPVEKSMGAANGHKVVCEITDYGNNNKSPEGKIIEILGYISDPGVDVISIIKAYGLSTEFPERVMNQAQRVPLEISEADMAGRRDLRDIMMVTIDGEDAKDLDDAVSLSMEGEYYKLGVHIADVSNYVQESSALDKEALKRGTSVYLVDRVIPMLPHRLCNGICSLNEQVDRLALSCLMTIDKSGNVIDHEIVESVINSNRRMTYRDVNEILENNDKELIEKYNELVPMFFLMKDLAQILRDKRKKRGSIDFDIPETKVILDEKGNVKDIKPYERNIATKLIEDFMLIANETVAEHFYWLKFPFVYRVHEDPDTDKIRKLAAFVSNFGYGIKIKNEEIHPKELQKLLVKCENTKEEALISRLTLRSMSKAKYSTECLGHFGLSCDYYCHFTSPIRRYPDLQIHRIIKEFLRGRLKEMRLTHYEEILPEVCRQSSACEKLADEAERETDKLKKAEYMSDRIGETFDGIISGVTNWGLYVELENTVEGLVHISKINDDFYIYNEDKYEIVGAVTNRRYCLGQKVRVKVNDVDLSLRTIDFILD